MMKAARKKLEELLASTSKPVAIFDLDGTLFDVTFRTSEILKRFLKLPHVREKYPQQAALVEKLKKDDHAYSLESTLNRLGIDRYSEHAAHFIHEAETFWFKHFFTDEFVQHDLPYEGAKECVHFFKERGAHIVYLSGRDIPNMSRGTLIALEQHGFPIKGHGVTMCLKQAYALDDYLFKKQSLESIRSEGTVVATFDNEPANVKLFLEEFPQAVNFHFDTHYAKELPLHGEHFYAIKSFREIGF